ncbi:MAG: hypothetical protein ACI9OH_003634 [Oleispira sp.]|jgi:hypothetical protein
MNLNKPSECNIFQKFTSLSVLFSESYINNRPNVLALFINNIQYGNPTGIQLTVANKEALSTIIDKIKKWMLSGNRTERILLGPLTL